MTDPIFSALAGRYATAREILAQPEIWRRFAPKLDAVRGEIRHWIARRQPTEIWFCGAGTSAFIGEALARHLNAAPGPARFRAIASTDLVASPEAYLRPGVRPLVVSFGRSGNSSESLGTLALLDALCPAADRLHITCNAASALATAPHPGPGECRVLLLPPETEDQGFAMTSSYTTMLLSALSCFDDAEPLPSARISRLADAAASYLTGAPERLQALPLPQRVVFLGSGPLTAVARESALKVLELTAGKVVTAWDSSLGFRHGPKAVMTDETLVCLLPSADPYARAYDEDIAREIAEQYGEANIFRAEGLEVTGSDGWDAVLHVLTAQVLAVLWSARLGLAVDDPFAGRKLSRVVSGVRLYPPPAVTPLATGLAGGLDIGGSKIESVLFGSDLERRSERRVAVQRDSYATFLDQVEAEVRWLETEAGGPVALGIGMPGIAEGPDGIAFASNLPVSGQPLVRDLAMRLGRAVPIVNDCKAFALSEARGGAGDGFGRVFGLIIGTGIGGGVVEGGKLALGLNGLPGEVGHIGVPAALLAERGLTPRPCGCGRSGCYEAHAAGPALAGLVADRLGRTMTPAEIVAGSGHDPVLARAVEDWLAIVAELLHTIQLAVDPDIVVLGGGLSRIDGLPERLTAAFARSALPHTRAPEIRVARFGDASGVRGAALLALEPTRGTI